MLHRTYIMAYGMLLEYQKERCASLPYGTMPSSSQQPARQQPVAATKKKDKKDPVLLLGSDKEESDEDESEDDFAADLESEMMSQGM